MSQSFKNNYYTVFDIMDLCDLAQSTAYKVIQSLNSELHQRGYITFRGKVPRDYAEKRLGLMIEGGKNE